MPAYLSERITGVRVLRFAPRWLTIDHASSVEGIPADVRQAACLLQRQSKLQLTELVDVEEGSAAWTQVLKQVCACQLLHRVSAVDLF